MSYEGWEFVPTGDGRTMRLAEPTMLTYSVVITAPAHCGGWRYLYDAEGRFVRTELPHRAIREAVWQQADALYRGTDLFFSMSKAATRCCDLVFVLRTTKVDETPDRMLRALDPAVFKEIWRGLSRHKLVPEPLEKGLAELERLGGELRDAVNSGSSGTKQ